VRILSFSGKGGVVKTSLAATGLRLSRLGYRTLVMSVDPGNRPKFPGPVPGHHNQWIAQA
jgi:CO dehydrogenase nickel-insertion accessory protein CooC1